MSLQKWTVCGEGHDLTIPGSRYPNYGIEGSGQCKICQRDKTRNRYKKKRVPGMCQNGHDKTVAGLIDGGSCKKCASITMRNVNFSRAGIKNANGSQFTLLDYDRAYQIQGGRCLICKRHATETGSILHSDHDHKTGVFRGLLCHGHNKALGFFNDSVEELQEAINYLKKVRNV